LESINNLLDLIRDRGLKKRSITALCGPPAAGKSTLALKLVKLLNEIEANSATVLPMDGFHFDNSILIPKNLLARKGSPPTFDVGGLMSILSRLKKNNESEVVVPVYDRKMQLAKAGARIIPKSLRYIIVEGNYLLLNQDPWKKLSLFFETTVSINVDIETLRQRLTFRWQDHGLNKKEIDDKVTGNDLINAELVIKKSKKAEFFIDGQNMSELV
jgi:pantothenate kinase